MWQCCSSYLHKCNRHNAVSFCRMGTRVWRNYFLHITENQLLTHFLKLVICKFDLWNAITRHRIELLRQFFFKILLIVSSVRCHDQVFRLCVWFLSSHHNSTNLKFVRMLSWFSKNYPKFYSDFYFLDTSYFFKNYFKIHWSFN